MARETDGQELSTQAGIVAARSVTPVDKLAAALAEGRSVLVTGLAKMSSILDMAASHPGLVRLRIFRVRPPLDLFAVLGQVSGDGGQSDTRLEQGFEALTNPGLGHDRIALLVEDAHLLPQTTLHYIELVLGAGQHLQVVLAGKAGLMETLALPGFATLRKRFSLHLVMPDADPRPAGLAAAATPPRQEPGAVQPGGTTRSRIWGYGVAASALAIAGLVGLALVMPKNPYMDGPGTDTPESGIMPTAGLAPVAAPVAVQSVPASSSPELDARAVLEQPDPAATPIPGTASDPAVALAGDAAGAAPAMPAGPDREPDVFPEVMADTANPQLGRLDDPRPAATADADLVVPLQPAAAAVPEMPLDPAPATMAALNEAAVPAPPPVPSQLGAPDPGPAAAPNVAPATVESAVAPAAVLAAEAAVAGMAAALSSSALPTPALPTPALPLPALPATALPVQRAVRLPRVAAAAQPAAPRPQPRPAATRPERVADVPPAPRQDSQHCREITLRLQLGETASNVDRTFLRNGCQ